MKNKHITGQLKLSAAAMRDTSCDRYAVHDAIEAHQLGSIMYIDNQWYHGIIPVKALYGIYEDIDIENLLNSDVNFASKALSDFLKEEAVSKLGLCGEITLTLEDTKTGEVFTAKITVNEGQVSYQKTSYVWSESVTV